MKRSSGLRLAILLALQIGLFGSCRNVVERRDVRPLVLHDVPAQNLAYRLETDTGLPSDSKAQDLGDKLPLIHTDFISNRKTDALIRTVVSPDGRRVLALYGTADEPNEAFRIDIYSDDGKFLRNLTPPDLSGAFPESAAWSPDGNFITFIAHKRTTPSPSPTPPEDIATAPPPASGSPTPTPSVAPAFAPVPLFNTEQIYICNRDGYELKPLTTREGLIYFHFEWAPDNHALAALACKEDEWNAREKIFRQPAGRPRLIAIDGQERLLDDELAEAPPVWSPDSSKVATAFEYDVGIYDTVTSTPTQARIPLREALLAASVAYEQKTAASAEKKNDNANRKADTQPPPTTDAVPASFNPIVRLNWSTPERLYIQTAYVRLLPHELINNFQRWHLVVLSAQAAILR